MEKSHSKIEKFEVVNFEHLRYRAKKSNAGWVDGWVDGWVGGRTGLKIAYSNEIFIILIDCALDNWPTHNRTFE